jgi:DHA3 family macrolide efflux protein-like MFS transporter
MSTLSDSPVLDRQPPPAPLSMAAVLRITTMRRIWIAQTISVFGDFVVLYAVIGVLAFKLHATPQQITGVQIAYLLPIALLGMIAGVFVDRWKVKPTLVASDLCRAALVLLMLVATRMWHFYAILAAISLFSSFFGPAQGVAIRSAVPLHGLMSANALMQQVMFGMRIIGPSAATALVGLFGPVSCYLIDSGSFVFSALLIASVSLIVPAGPPLAPPADPGAGADGARPSPLGRVWLDLRQGINFIVHHAGLLFVILAFTAGMFVVGCFGPLIAVYVRDSVHGSTQSFGFASSLIGIGMFVGINGITVLARRAKPSLLVYSGLAGIALGLALLALTAHVWTTFVGTFLIGVAVAAIFIPSQTMIQQETPPALMGRVGSTTMSLVFTAQISGLVLSGILVAAVGVRQVFAGCALFLVLLILAGRLWMEPEARPAAPTAAA